MFGGFGMMEIMRVIAAQGLTPAGVGGTTPDQPVAGAAPANDSDVMDPAGASPIDDEEIPGSEPETADEEPELPEYEQPDFYKERMEQEAKAQEELDRIDEFDLTGEKRAAEALEREDALKQESIEAKADQDKEFFAEQDEKQKEFFKEQDAESERQLQEDQTQEFWDGKKAEEVEANLDKEVQAIDAEAAQAQERGTLDENTAAELNNELNDAVGEHESELEEIAAPEAKPADSEWMIKNGKPDGFWPEGSSGKPSDMWPAGTEVNEINQKEEFFKNVDAPGPTWLDGPPKDTSEDFFRNVDYIRNPNLPPGWMKEVPGSDLQDMKEKFVSAAQKFIKDESGSLGDQKAVPETPKVETPAPEAPKPEGMNPDLVEMYRQRQQDLGQKNVDQSVQTFAENVQKIDAPTPVPPAPTIEAPAINAEPQQPAPVQPAPQQPPPPAPAMNL